jgi:hypothetical protein
MLTLNLNGRNFHFGGSLIMKKTLLCLAIGIVSFYVGTFAYNLIYWEKAQIDILPIENEVPLAVIPSDILTDDDLYKYGYPENPDGVYFPNDELESETALILGTWEVNSAEIKIGNKLYRSEFPLINEHRVSFKTVKVQGIEYSFEGTFIHNPFKNWIDDGEVNLIGTLTKRKNAKILYKSKTKYIFDSEVCAWRDVEFEQAN